MRKPLAVLLLATIATIPPLTTSAAPITVPSGLNLGDHYRLAFVTSTTRNATSSIIADYNSFVTTDANTVTQLAALGTTWSAIASTATIAAYDNTLTHPGTNPDYPIYNLSGALVASSNSGLWSGSLLSGLNIDETGSLHNTVVWTGSTPAGTGDTGAQLGTGNAREGTSTNANSAWITFFTVDSNQSQSLYAMSGVLTVVPEPGALALVSLAAAGMIAWLQRERRTLLS
jgi:PEP-CTERM motif